MEMRGAGGICRPIRGLKVLVGWCAPPRAHAAGLLTVGPPGLKKPHPGLAPLGY